MNDTTIEKTSGGKDDTLLTASAAARLMNLKSSEAVAYHVKRGHLPSVPRRYKNGATGFWLRKSDVQAFIDASVAADVAALLNTDEAARKLGVSTQQVVRMVQAGRLSYETQTPALGALGRPGLCFRLHHLAQFYERETDPATSMTAPEVRVALHLLGDDQVLHLARTRAWTHLVLKNDDGSEHLYVRRSDVEAFREAGDNPLRDRYSLHQAAEVMGHSGPSQAFRLARAGALRGVRDNGRLWLDASDVHARRDRSGQRKGKGKRNLRTVGAV